MKRIFATTATALLLSTGAIAQDSMAQGIGAIDVAATDLFASDVMGARLYASDRTVSMTGGTFDPADGWDDIGEINNLIVSVDGDLPAAIVGVGGFLGIGEKDVAISMDHIALYTDADGDRFFVTTATAEVLENAPAFEMALDGSGTGDPTEATQTAANTAPETAPETTIETMTAGTDAAIAGDAVAWEGYVPVIVGDLTTDQLAGARVYDAMKNDVGEIGQLVTTADGQITGAVVDVGGFLGIGEKPVLLNFDALEILKVADGDAIIVVVNSSEGALESMPAYSE